MEIEAIQAFRRERLKALIDSDEFGGNLSAVGRALGYQDGVYVRQMRDGVRAISEKTVLKIEGLDGRNGWFSEPKAPSPIEASESGLAMLAAFEEMASEDKEEMLRDAQERAAKFRRLAQEAISRHTSKPAAAPGAFEPGKPPVAEKPAHRRGDKPVSEIYTSARVAKKTPTPVRKKAL